MAKLGKPQRLKEAIAQIIPSLLWSIAFAPSRIVGWGVGAAAVIVVARLLGVKI